MGLVEDLNGRVVLGVGFLEFFGGEDGLAVFELVADLFDGAWSDGFFSVVPGVADEGGDIGEVLVGDVGGVFEAGHGGGWGVFFAIHYDGAHESLEENGGELFG